MGHILGLRRQSAMRKLKSLGKDLFNDKVLPCNFDSNISSYIAMLDFEKETVLPSLFLYKK